MKLTETEEKLILRLRKGEENTVRYRYWFLSYGIFNFALAIAAFIYIQSLAHDLPPSVYLLLLVYFIPTLIFLFCLGAYHIATTISYWKGNPTKALLLKLIDEHTRSDDKST